MIQPEPLGLDDVPQAMITGSLIPVDLLMCRRDSPHPEPGPLNHLARIGSGIAMGRQADRRGEVGIDHQNAAVSLDQNPLCPSHQIAIDP